MQLPGVWKVARQDGRVNGRVPVVAGREQRPIHRDVLAADDVDLGVEGVNRRPRQFPDEAAARSACICLQVDRLQVHVSEGHLGRLRASSSREGEGVTKANSIARPSLASLPVRPDPPPRSAMHRPPLLS
jgi:hypothetical protein